MNASLSLLAMDEKAIRCSAAQAKLWTAQNCADLLRSSLEVPAEHVESLLYS